MKPYLVPIACLALGLAGTCNATDAKPLLNPEMQRLVAEDQSDRREAPNIDWSKVRPRDEARRASVRRLLAEGALKEGADFGAAALVLQHGRAPADYLLAHSLAVIAVSKGEKSALWLVSATLDRYLWSIDQPQVYGTQFTRPRTPEGEWTQAPYAQDVVPDALRRELGVKTQAEQIEQMQAMNREVKAPGAK